MLLRSEILDPSRQVLKYVATFAPPSLHGNMPGQTAAHLWYTMQVALEESGYSTTPVHGFVADLVKAYNLLPRAPVLAAAKAAGVPEPIVGPGMGHWLRWSVASELEEAWDPPFGPARALQTDVACLAWPWPWLTAHSIVTLRPRFARRGPPLMSTIGRRWPPVCPHSSVPMRLFFPSRKPGTSAWMSLRPRAGVPAWFPAGL